jgi:hypothetical protein
MAPQHSSKSFSEVCVILGWLRRLLRHRWVATLAPLWLGKCW